MAACSQTGDFGRVREAPTSIFDPRPGQNRQGNFQIIQTDEEKQMQRSLQRFVSTIDGDSWISKVRLTANALQGRYPDESDYFKWLRVQPFGSSSGRYAKLLSEVQADTMTLPAAFAAICAVQNTDRRRALAASSVGTTSDQTFAGLDERRVANNTQISRFAAVLSFRYASYSYALEQLLVETPHNSAARVDDRLNTLAIQVQAAEANQFC
ncbi:MAG: hypothetical protein L3J13_02690 [Devosiaceae bacterium]|nr:hypothetical protein [Devosiaceae bacterium]